MLSSEAINAIRNVRNAFGLCLSEARDLWDTYGTEAGMRSHLEAAGRSATPPKKTYSELEREVAELRLSVGALEDALADERREFDLRLLEAAHCPNCDNTGTTPQGDECEWCFHRKRAVARLKSPPKPGPSVCTYEDSHDGQPCVECGRTKQRSSEDSHNG